MPAPLALPLGLAAGSFLAWLAASAPPGAAAGSELRARTAALYFGIFVLGPAVGLLEAAGMPWANLYVADVPSAAALVLAIAAGAAPVVGERLARGRLDRGDSRTPLGIALGGIVATLVTIAIAWSRIEVVTSQTAFARGLGGAPLFEHRAGAAFVLAGLALFAGYAFAVRALAGPSHYARVSGRTTRVTRERRGSRRGSA